jgi:type II secretory pathway component PulF
LGKFAYKAVSERGTHVSGVVEAADRRSAVADLAGRGHFVTELVEQAAARSYGVLAGLSTVAGLGGRIKAKELHQTTSQLATALRAGLPLMDALSNIRDQQHRAASLAIMDDLVHSVSSGESLSEAMSKHKRTFSPLYLSMVRVGETGGILDKTLTQLADLLGRDEKIKRSMLNASFYPILVLIVGLVSVAIIITWVLPSILATISGGVALLPWPTRLLMALSDFGRNYGWLVVAGLVVGVIALRRWIAGTGRLAWDALKLKVPILGSVLRTIAVARFGRTLGALTKGGVGILESLAIVRDTLGNELLAREMDTVAEKVKAGAALAEPLKESGHFPPLLVQIVAVGEQTGKLDEMLLNAADTFDEVADSAITRFLAVFPTLLILLLALVVGFIIAATLLPIVIMELGGGML